MTFPHGSRPNAQRGFSLIEMMVALVAGLIVVGAVLAFTVATVRANSQTVVGTRLSQDLRTALNLMTREMRRAGYDRNAELSIATNSPGILYTQVSANAARDCIVLSYNRPSINTSAAVVNAERKGFRRVVQDGIGVIQANPGLASTTPTACNQTEGWTNLTDPQQVDIQELQFNLAERCVFPNAGGNAGLPPPCTPNSSGITAVVRHVDLTLLGALVREPDVQRRLTDSVRIRTDDLVFTAGVP